ncbi:MAG: biotin-dependent carboxyltransferase family protein [Myxococcota bacterium]|nr:biotin-dependent carboxyltransferase family protein [Myxococcota bacterium]
MIAVAAVAGLATLQDGGRPGHMHEGVPPGGPLVPELFARANAAARNAQDQAAIELMGRMTLEARRRTVIATDAGDAWSLDEGETCTLAGEGARVRYIAVRGGFDVPVVLGGRGTLLVAGLGGHEGRPLRRGDILRAGDSPMAAARRDLPPPPDREAPLRIVPGPDTDRFEARDLVVLLSSTFVVDARSDRVGIRLTGASRLTRPSADVGGSSPMVRGAIQVPPSGELIVLGPDHPTTGGYPVVATVARACLGSLGARPLGAAVRFVTFANPASAG